MSSSIISNNNCGPVTGLLSNQSFLLHAQTPQKTISPPPLWRTFYAPPPSPLLSPASTLSSSSSSTSQIPTSLSNVSNDNIVVLRGSPTTTTTTTQHITLNLKKTATTTERVTQLNNNINSIINVNLPNQRMTLQKLPTTTTTTTASSKSAAEQQITQGTANIQKSIMSVSKLVRPTPKSQHPHQQHLSIHQQPHLMSPTQHQHQLQHQHQHQHQHQQHQHHHYISDIQTGPINLVTNSQTTELSTRSRPSSNSSVDIESDDIPTQSQQQQQQQQHLTSIGVNAAAVSIPTAAAAAAAAAAASYQFDYSHLYANKQSFHHNAAAAAAVDALRLHHAPYPAYTMALAASLPNGHIFPALSHHQSLTLAPPPPSVPVPTNGLPVSPTATGTIIVPSNLSPTNSSTEHHQRHQQQQQQHHHSHHQQLQLQEHKSRLTNSNEHMFSPPLPAAAPPASALSNGTYLNCKSSPASDSTDSSSTENYFKIPNISSGKEGSLKHRILTRPAALQQEKEEKTSKNAVISTHNTTANFKKGSYIELANGVLRRVEDMRTEDFIQCAERSIHLQLAESTVVRIDTTKPQMVIITFSYDRNRSKAEIEVSVDHPFFVYGQGWASCDPEKSHKAFGLKCQRLQVGDICISLTQRTTPPSVAIKTEVTTKEESLRYVKAELPPPPPPPPPSSSNAIENGGAMPLTMSIKNEMQTVMPPPSPTTTNCNGVGGTTIFTRPTAHFMLPSHHQIPYPDFAELVAAYNSSAHMQHMHAAVAAAAATTMPPPPTPDAINGFYHQTQQLLLQGKVTAADLRLQPPSLPPPPAQLQAQTQASSYCPPPRTTLLQPPQQQQQRSPSQQLSPMHEQHTQHQHQQQPQQDQPFDASIASRKRRWSAPEGDCDGTTEQHHHHPHSHPHSHHQRDHCPPNSKLYKTAMAPVTT